ncbi:MAG TPA: hypothetical protein ENH94_04880 [Phycisphaerales bacterium]|nr:hypothetical protein [Phycisphaerales bacterium]
MNKMVMFWLCCGALAWVMGLLRSGIGVRVFGDRFFGSMTALAVCLIVGPIGLMAMIIAWKSEKKRKKISMSVQFMQLKRSQCADGSWPFSFWRPFTWAWGVRIFNLTIIVRRKRANLWRRS